MMWFIGWVLAYVVFLWLESKHTKVRMMELEERTHEPVSAPEDFFGAQGIVMRSEFVDGMLVVILRTTNPIAQGVFKDCELRGFAPPVLCTDDLGEYICLEVQPANMPQGGYFVPYPDI